MMKYGILMLVCVLAVVVACTPGDNANGNTVVESGDAQEVHVTFMNGNYDLSTDTVAVGKPVQMIFHAEQLPGCSRSVVIPEYGVKQLITPENNIVEFTPTKAGDITVSCSMGMYVTKLKAE